MTFSVRHESLTLAFRDPFKIARATDTHHARTVITHVRDEDRGDEGTGESFAEPYYGETMETVPVVLPRLARAADELADRLASRDRGDAVAALDALGPVLDASIGHHGGAKAGIDIALHDLVGKRLGLPVYELLGLSPEVPPTDFTLGIDAPEVVAERARRAAKFPALKIKLGGPGDLATLEAVRAVFSGPIRVDANTGWEPEPAARLIPELVRLGVELIEQPFLPHRLDQLRWLQERSSLPIVADESSVTADDLEGLVGVVRGVNVKLSKVGGIGPAKRMLERARALGFKTFLGCMEETTVGIAASAAVASLADWVDLDGNLLLAADPYEGLELGSDCRWRLSTEPGLGVRPRGVPPH
jgi:L-alanine-DL-glutamate epimerase-like enolase superfamily enzyme